MTDEEIVAALAEALRAFDAETRAGIPDEDLATALLPTVRRVAEQRAAEELLSAADDLSAHGWFSVVVTLRARAAALTATPSHGRSAT